MQQHQTLIHMYISEVRLKGDYIKEILLIVTATK